MISIQRRMPCDLALTHSHNPVQTGVHVRILQNVALVGIMKGRDAGVRSSRWTCEHERSSTYEQEILYDT